jgi:osmotically inducible lipoprotein OsmB
MLNKYKLLFIASLALGLNACSSMQTNRGITGAALGSAAGVGISAITGGDLATGAIFGAATGATVGVVTARESRGPRYYARPQPQPVYYQQTERTRYINNNYYSAPPPQYSERGYENRGYGYGRHHHHDE